MREAIWQSIPYTSAGFFDDSQQSGASCFMLIILGTVIRLAELSGVMVSIPKLIWARPGLVGTPTLLKPIPRGVNDIDWSFATGLAVGLGRELDTIQWTVTDTEARVDEAIQRVRQLIASKSVGTAQVSVKDFQSATGLVLYL